MQEDAEADCVTRHGRTTRCTKLDYWQRQKKADRQTPFLCGFRLFLFHHSSGMQRGPPFSLPLSHSLISALLLPVCTVYISFDQRVRRISMCLSIPFRSRLKLPVCQRSRSCKASPRYGRRRSGLVRLFITNEHGLALPTRRGRTKSLAMHVLSGPWCRTQRRALGCMNEVVDSMPRFPCLCGTLCHKGSLNTLSLSVVLENRLIHTKAKPCLFFLFLFRLTQRKAVLILTYFHTKRLFFFFWSKQNKEITSHAMILKFIIGGLRNSPSFFNCFMRGCILPGTGSTAGCPLTSVLVN